MKAAGTPTSADLAGGQGVMALGLTSIQGLPPNSIFCKGIQESGHPGK